MPVVWAFLKGVLGNVLVKINPSVFAWLVRGVWASVKAVNLTLVPR